MLKSLTCLGLFYRQLYETDMMDNSKCRLMYGLEAMLNLSCSWNRIFLPSYFPGIFFHDIIGFCFGLVVVLKIIKHVFLYFLVVSHFEKAKVLQCCFKVILVFDLGNRKCVLWSHFSVILKARGNIKGKERSIGEARHKIVFNSQPLECSYFTQTLSINGWKHMQGLYSAAVTALFEVTFRPRVPKFYKLLPIGIQFIMIIFSFSINPKLSC